MSNLPKCPECETELREGAKYCDECGTKLTQEKVKGEDEKNLDVVEKEMYEFYRAFEIVGGVAMMIMLIVVGVLSIFNLYLFYSTNMGSSIFWKNMFPIIVGVGFAYMFFILAIKSGLKRGKIEANLRVRGVTKEELKPRVKKRIKEEIFRL